MSESEAKWNSLEASKLLVAAATPIIVLLMGAKLTSDIAKQTAQLASASEQQQRNWVAEQSASQFERAEAAAQVTEVAHARAEIWKRLAEPLNDIYAYFNFVGRWKDFTPDDILERKRSSDALVYGYRPFFSKAFVDAYRAYINAAFDEDRGWGMDAGLRTTAAHRPKPGRGGQLTERDNGTEVHFRYQALQSVVAQELRLDPIAQTAPPARPE